MLGVTVRQVTTYQNRKEDPLPIAVRAASRGQAHQYDIFEIHDWGVRQRIKELGVNDDGEFYDKEFEQARLYHGQANRVELEVEQLRGKLLPTDQVLETWQSLFANMRAKLLGLPTKAAHAVQAVDDLSDIRDALTVHIHEALEEIVHDGIPDEVRERIETVTQ